jgi:Domain of unknown function (DUF4436)
LTLLVSHDSTVEEIKLAAGDHIASSSFEVDLNEGSVAHYPFDSYVARLGIELRDGKSALRLPARITVWEGALGYNLHTTGRPGPDPDDTQLTTIVARNGAFALFALCAYGAMLVLAGCALTIGILTFADVRRPEASLSGLSPQSPLPSLCCATPCREPRRLAYRRICGCFCGPNWRSCSRLS